ncbi:MAG: efflux RND transporter permease subunit [Planctomycetes bacterium]|nr:efflux RND transporter permease subunit [Planctomycetota bacterium]
MLQSLVAFCLASRGSVIAVACALIAYGVHVAAHAPLDVLPDFAPPQVVVQCEAPGLSAEQVELLVTAPIEASLQGAGNLDSVRSQSIQGLCVVTATFEEGTDPFRARQVLAEQLATVAGELPAGVEAPKLTPLTSATMDLLKVGLVSTRLTPMELRTFAEWTVAPRLRAVAGVSSVTLFGGEVRQLQVECDPARLAAAGVALESLLEAVRRATGIRGAGFVDTPAQRVVIETRGQALTPAELARTLVEWRDGRPITVGDVASVVDGPRPRFGDCLVQGKPAVLVKALSQHGANTLEVTRAVEAALDELKPAFAEQGIEVFGRIHRPANFIETAVANLGHSLWIGALLVAAVLFLFLADAPAAFVSLTAIPLSLLAAVVVLTRLGMALDTMTLGGLAIAIGEVVDDAIIDVENIVRRLRQEALSATRRSPLRVVLDASLEVRRSVVHATFVVVVVFLPVLMLSGLQGRFFAPLGIAYIAAVLASLVVALTLTPALALTLLGRRDRARTEPRFAQRLRAAYSALLRRVVAHPLAALLIALLLASGGAAAVPWLGSEFLPDFREGHFVLQLSMAPGASIDEMRRLGARVSEELLRNPHLATVEQQIGRAELGEDPWGPHRSEFHIELAPLAPDVEAQVADEIRAVLAPIPGIQTELLTFLGDRIGESISGETAQVVVNVFGEELDALDAAAARLAEQLAMVPGAVDVQRGSLPGMPALEVELRRDRLAASGFAATDVLDVVETAFQGRTLAQIHDGPRSFDVVATFAPALRDDPARVGELLLRSASGAMAPLRELAHVRATTGRYLLLREGGRRRQTVTCNVSGRDVASFVAEARARLDGAVALPEGNYLSFSGAAQQEQVARDELLLHGAMALLAVVILLGAAFGNARNLLLALSNLPFAFVGGVLAVAWTGGTLSMGSMVGFVTLFGVTMRNSIMLLAHIEHVVVEERAPFGAETVVRAASERLLPILMTALVTGLGLLPIAIGSGSAGREIEGPMAVVILGGLATSTLLNLLLLPTLALRFGRFSAAME